MKNLRSCTALVSRATEEGDGYDNDIEVDDNDVKIMLVLKMLNKKIMLMKKKMLKTNMTLKRKR
jgi:hypothetical protein